MKMPYEIGKFRKGDVYVDAFLEQSKMEVLDIINSKVILKNTWFDGCSMSWLTENVEHKNVTKETYIIVTHPYVLSESVEETEVILSKVNQYIEDYKKIIEKSKDRKVINNVQL